MCNTVGRDCSKKEKAEMPISASKETVGDQATSMRNWYQSHKILKSTLISGPKMPPRLFLKKEIPSLTAAQWGQFGFLPFLPPEEKEKTTDLTSRCALSRVLWREGAPQRREGGGIIVSWDGVSYSSIQQSASAVRGKGGEENGDNQGIHQKNIWINIQIEFVSLTSVSF